VISLKNNKLAQQVAILYMMKYSDLQIRQELKITRKQLQEVKEIIKQSFYNVGINENVI
jgi:hypothetical protein